MGEPDRSAGAGASDPEVEALRARLSELEETVAAIRRGEVDALLIGDEGRPQVYTLASAERPYRLMVERMKQGAVTVSEEGLILYANGTFAALLGQPLERVIGTPLAELVEEGPGEPVALTAGDREASLRRADGARLPVGISTFEIGEEGVVVLCAIVTDLTQQRTHERLRRSEQRLQEVDQRKDEFLAMLGHELRNPLGPIFHAVEVLDEEVRGASTPRSDWALGVMRRQLGHLRRIVDDLLDLGRISRGLVELRWATVDLAAVVAAALDAVRPLVDRRGQELAVETEDDLWVRADPTRLVQVLGNLLHNAVKYTPAGGHVRVVARREGQRAVLAVEDDGAGIPPDLLPQVFDLFTQGAVELARSEEGLGLGLNVVRRLVELHGGEVAAFSEGPGRGSRFEVRLPLVPPPEPAEAVDREVPAAADGEGRRVLVVDDNRDAAQVLAVLLRGEGHRVEEAHDGPSALEAAAVLRPEAVLLDIGLPGIDGYEVARRLRQRIGSDVLLVAVTGYGQPDDRSRSEQAGFDHHMVKPVDIRELKRLVREAPRRPGA